MKHTKSILITAPSGAGKTTLVKKLLADCNLFDFSISCTTRERRETEEDGKDYYFISQNVFEQKIKNDEFIEWEEVYGGSFYGTLKSEIERIQNNQKIPLFDIDIMGAMSIKKTLCTDVLSIFIAPPNLEVLEARLRSRHTETEDKIITRLHKANSEMKFANFFDKKVVNDDLDEAYGILKKYIFDFIC
jgi:guanylate kinase